VLYLEGLTLKEKEHIHKKQKAQRRVHREIAEKSNRLISKEKKKVPKEKRKYVFME